MKKIITIFSIILLVHNTSKADVIYSPHTEFGTALSLEIVGSYEFLFSNYNTINFWGGIGAVSMLETLQKPAYGSEMAIELRHYFKKGIYENFNLGLYAGFAYMRHPNFYGGHLTSHDNSVGFVPGLKLTYKKRINSWLVGEPYVGISTPWYDDDFGDLFHWISDSEPGMILTVGLRIGFNKLNINK